MRGCHPNAVSYRDLEPQKIYRINESEKKGLYSKRVLDIEHGIFTPLVFTTTGGMRKECLMHHSRLAKLIAIKKDEQYAKTISWIRTRTPFALLRSALVCLRGSRTRRVPCDIKNVYSKRCSRQGRREPASGWTLFQSKNTDWLWTSGSFGTPCVFATTSLSLIFLVTVLMEKCYFQPCVVL